MFKGINKDTGTTLMTNSCCFGNSERPTVNHAPISTSFQYTSREIVLVFVLLFKTLFIP